MSELLHCKFVDEVFLLVIMCLFVCRREYNSYEANHNCWKKEGENKMFEENPKMGVWSTGKMYGVLFSLIFTCTGKSMADAHCG